MIPALALVLCTIFALYLLWLEGKGSPCVSPATWIPTTWLLAVASKPLAIWFGVAGSNEDGSALDEVLLTTLAVAGIAVLIRRRFNWQRVLRSHGWLIGLLFFMFVSAIWSDITLIALRRWVRQLIVVIMALVIISETDRYQAMESLLRRFAYLFIPFSLVVIKYYPASGVSYSWSGVKMWTGIALHKNSFGSMCSISALFFLWAYFQRRDHTNLRVRYQRWADTLILLIALYLLSGAEKNSATAAATLSAGVATLLTLRLVRSAKRMVPKAALMVLLIFLIAYGVAAPFQGGSNVASLSAQLGRDDTLTGRTDIWAAVLPAMAQHRILGHGFESFWTNARRQVYMISDAHNGYLDILLELGAAGLALYICWFLSSANKLYRTLATNYNWASLSLSYLIMCLVFNVTESTLGGLADQITAIVVLASLVVPHDPRLLGGERSQSGEINKILMKPNRRVRQPLRCIH